MTEADAISEDLTKFSVSKTMEQYRIEGPTGAPFGRFQKGKIRIIACEGADDETMGWDHVSVSTSNRCPTWEEMRWVKKHFWQAEACVIQFHPPKSTYYNFHPYVLHLWRQQGSNHPLPPREVL